MASITYADKNKNGASPATDWRDVDANEVKIVVNGKQDALGFTPENISNKDTDVTLAANSDTKYPSQKAVKAYADTKQNTISAGHGIDFTSNVVSVNNTVIQDLLVSGTNIKTINSSSILGSGNLVVSAPNASAIAAGIAKLYTATGSNTDGSMDQNSITNALSSKQATLVSATNIKTINGVSVLGSGDLVISGSGLSDPLTTNGDIIARISGSTTRLPKGSEGTFLGISSGLLGYFSPSISNTNGPIGDIFSEDFSGNLTSYTNFGTASASIVSSSLHLSGGNTTVNNVIYRTNTISCFDYCYRKIRFSSTSNATAEGIGIGFTSRSVISQQQTVYATVNTSSGASRGTVTIKSISSSGTIVVLATSSSKLSYVNGDSLELYLLYNSGSIEVHLYNLTTTTNAPVFISYTVPFTVVSPSTGYVAVQSPSIYILDGTQTVTLDVFGTNYNKNPLLIRLGDSIGTGAFAGSYQGREASLTASQLLGDQIVYSSGGNTVQDVINAFGLVIAVKPKYVTINLGTNDIANSITLGDISTPGTYAYRIEQLKNLCIANGIIPIFLYITPSNVISNTTIDSFNAFLLSQYGGQFSVIDWATQLKDGGSALSARFDSGDGIHPGTLAHSYMSVSFLSNAGFLQKIKQFGVYSNLIFDGKLFTANAFKIDTGNAGFGDLPLSTSVTGTVGGLSFLTSSGGLTTDKLGAYYFNGSTYKSAWEFVNTTGSALGTLILMKGGGTVSSAAAITTTSTIHSDGQITSNVGASFGVTNKYNITPDVSGFGEVPNSAGFSGGNSGGLSFLSSASGTAGNIVVGAYWNGSTYRSAWEYVDVASGFSTLKLMRSGGTVTSGADFKLTTSGNGLYIKEGSNATMGVATLSSGAVTVSTTKVTSTSRIFLSVESLGTVTVPTPVAVTARSAGTSFTITSSNAVDTSIVSWVIIEPA